MTISSNLRKAGPFSGNAATTAFPFAYKVFTTSDVVVTKSDGVTETTLTLTTDYTVALNPDQNANPGGTVTYPASGSPLPVGQTLTLSSSVPELQQTSITTQGGFYPKIIEDALDRLTIFVQQLREIMGRSLRFPVSDPALNITLPTAAKRANNLLGFDFAGNVTAVVPAAQSASALAINLADSADATKGTTLIGHLGGTLRAFLTTLRANIDALAQSTGATLIGAAGGLTVQTALDAKAALAGLLTQVFRVANAVGANDAVPLGQADARYAPLGAGPIQGAFRSLAGSALGTSAVVTYTIGELVTGDGAGNYQTTRAWNNTITMTTLGAGGLDVGTVSANTWYYAYGITKPDGTKALIASLSSTGPSFANAVGYTKSARIGAIITDGTANKYPLSFQQYGRNVQYKIAAGTNLTLLPAIAAGVQGTVGTTLVSAAIGFFVPPTACRIRGLLFSNSGTAQIAPNAIATLQGGAGAVASGSTATPSTPFDFAIESTNLYYASNASSSGAYCLGFEDNI